MTLSSDPTVKGEIITWHLTLFLFRGLLTLWSRDYMKAGQGRGLLGSGEPHLAPQGSE